MRRLLFFLFFFLSLAMSVSVLKLGLPDLYKVACLPRRDRICLEHGCWGGVLMLWKSL